MVAQSYRTRAQGKILNACIETIINPIDEWLEEWRRWTLGEVGPDVPRCVSAENKWNSPQHWDPPEPPVPPLREWMGYRVERVVQRLPEPCRTALRVDILTVRQPTERIEQFYERKRRMAQLPAWQYHIIVDESIKTVAMMLKLV